ncbi:cyclin-dependent kinase-like 2 isoform X1 [Lingula anatina]|uniref:Cyclin-dependent kinase-like 2 n=1 Tax=Lingula anatina TaxID=7574 RepID=A0A1S3KA73_LINAN|nr:cyclin-dependent kinase-like 2 isoform X1 [Lingula anatina]|eukprot:XP_013419402.1 cyclin-dependent kinase-like 2 isoform X1 [Lingula anatina]
MTLYKGLRLHGREILNTMEKYENLGLVGEGSYGMVLKCKHKETGQIVAIKKFLESEDDKMVKKIAMREVRMLKQLRHENLVNLIEVFRRKKRLYLVFEFVDHTVLDDLERCPNGLDEHTCRKILWQVLKGIEFCHLHNIIHRDIKPENILVSKSGIVKLCDFGFARTLAQPGETYTDYVATRWYRAPELLVGDTKYGRAVDIWAIGCLLAEMLTGEPLFPGDSDIDQLYHIINCFGNLNQRQREIFQKNPLFAGMRLPEVKEIEPLKKKFPRLSVLALAFLKLSLQLEADDRPTCSQLLKHEFFQKDEFSQKFPGGLKAKIQKEYHDNPLLKNDKNGNNSGRDSSEENKGSGGKKKKKEKKVEKPESKDSGIEDKPRRKHSEPEKAATKKSSPTDQTGGKASVAVSPAAAAAGSPHKQKDTGGGSVEPHALDSSMSSSVPMLGQTSSSQSPASQPSSSISSTHTTSPPSYHAPVTSIHFSNAFPPGGGVVNSTGPPPLRVSEKHKRSPPLYSHPAPGGKKAPTPNHHSTSLSPQVLQTERTSLHEKALHYDKMVSKKKGHHDSKKEKESLSLPEVKGAEGNPKNKGKKPYMATMPSITTIDPFNLSGGSDKDPNLPSV